MYQTKTHQNEEMQLCMTDVTSREFCGDSWKTAERGNHWWRELYLQSTQKIKKKKKLTIMVKLHLADVNS